MQRSRACHCERLPNLIHHKPYVLVHFVIPEADRPIAALCEPGRTARIMLRGRFFEMLRPVELSDESPREADEVDDVRAERCLSAELVPVELRPRARKTTTLSRRP
jgi:hypothetical protein